MNVKPGCRDATDQLVPCDALMVANGGDDVPIAKGDIAVEHGECLGAVEVHDTTPHRVHGRAVGGDDVNPEMKRARTT